MSEAPSTTVLPGARAAVTAAASTSGNRPPRNRRRGRGPPKDDGPNGKKTDHAQATTERGSGLHGGAPDFIPSSLPPTTKQSGSRRYYRHQQPSKSHIPVVAPATSAQTPSGPGKRRVSLLRSTATDIATRTQEDIANSVYECAICTNEISMHSKVWSCHTCWTVFHIGCITKWSKNDGSAALQTGVQGEGVLIPKQWRCPGCNLPQDTTPLSYNCWCEKEMEPKPIPGLPPHTCGQTCGRQRVFPKSCPHPCDQMCHAGPCPPCTHMGPQQSCFCSKEAISRPCLETNYDLGWSCGRVCGDVMPCGKHTCPKPCHEGLCGACGVEVEAICYCGKVKRPMKCDELEEEKESYGWIGEFDCHQTCNRAMDCGEHQCEKTCHPQDEEPPHCSRSADIVKHCPCGKTALAELLEQPRIVCTDPVPNCKNPCGKRLACGHDCDQVCHAGKCLPCLRTVSIKCRCGRNAYTTICHQGTDEPPQCMRVCKVHLNCGRHECGERCCPGERKASDRQNQKRKMKMVTLDLLRPVTDEIEAEHICLRTCGRMLKCGNHTCQDLCHKGPCNSCKEAIFQDLFCGCGQTILQAPLPCGTQPPPCTLPCDRARACGHPQTAHNCHVDEEACPKCPFLTDKPCMCGKQTLKNQPCWRSGVSCGLVCGKKLRCGSHNCQRLCHRTGDCEDSLASCQQQCGKAKKRCGHPCDRLCHAPSVCREDKPCPFKVIITCPCQRKKEEVRCNAHLGLSDAASRQNVLKCDDECARLERNRSLAAALHISDGHTNDHVPYSTATLKMYLEDVKWAHAQEELLRAFAADPKERRFRFKPMKSHQRAFLHSIAEDFGFDGESMDPEPHRHVLLFKTPKFVAAPMKTLQQAARIKRGALNIGAPVHSMPARNPVAGAGTTPTLEKPGHPWNGFVLKHARFGLTVSELQPHVIKAAPTTVFGIHFLNDPDQIVLLHSSSSSGVNAPHHAAALLESLESRIASEMIAHHLAKEVTLGVFETSSSAEPRLVHQKGDGGPVLDRSSTGGWSQIAARGSAPVRAPQVQPVGQRSVYTVLGSRLAEAKRKKLETEQRAHQQADVVDDWEEAVEKDERETDNTRCVPGKDGRWDGGIGSLDEVQDDQVADDARLAQAVAQG